MSYGRDRVMSSSSVWPEVVSVRGARQENTPAAVYPSKVVSLSQNCYHVLPTHPGMVVGIAQVQLQQHPAEMLTGR